MMLVSICVYCALALGRVTISIFTASELSKAPSRECAIRPAPKTTFLSCVSEQRWLAIGLAVETLSTEVQLLHSGWDFCNPLGTAVLEGQTLKFPSEAREESFWRATHLETLCTDAQGCIITAERH